MILTKRFVWAVVIALVAGVVVGTWVSLNHLEHAWLLSLGVVLVAISQAVIWSRDG